MMSSFGNQKKTNDNNQYASMASLLIIIVSFLVVLGWLFNQQALIKLSTDPNIATMKLNTAICFMFLSVGLWALVNNPRLNKKQKIKVSICIAIPLLLSGLTLAEYVFNISLGIDHLFFLDLISTILIADASGRMSEITSINMVIFSLALWLLVINSNRNVAVAQGLALIGTWIGLTSLSGYFFEVKQLYSLPGYSSISFKTSLLFVLLGTGVLYARPEKGLMATFTSDLYGGIVVRRLLPILILLPYLVGWTRLQLHEQGLGVQIAPSIFATTYALIFIAIAWISARKINAVDDLRQQRESQLEEERKKAVNEKSFSDMMIESLPGILYFYNENKKLLRWNRNFEIASGYSQEEIAKMHPLDFFLEDERSLVNQKIEEVFIGGQSFVEARFLSKSGSATPYFFTGRRIRFGGQHCLVGIGVDIAERKHAEEQLRIAAIAFEAQEGIAISDSEEVILRVNQSFTKITGYETNEIIGRKSSILKDKHQSDSLYDEISKALRRDYYWQGEVVRRRKDGKVFPVWLTIKAVTNEKGEVTNYVSSFSDLTQVKEDEAKIHSLVFYDSLTGLPNRRLLGEHLERTFEHHEVNPNYRALLILDLDNFKRLNDTKGHSFGDLLLIEVAKRLQNSLGGDGFVARLGGDEFVVLLDNLGSNLELAFKRSEDIGGEILNIINGPYSLKSHQYHCSGSIGVSLYGDSKVTVDDLLKRADFAMYQAKDDGRNKLRFYDPKMQAKLAFKSAMENDLHRALDEQQFQPYFQKQVYHNGQILAAEVLIRWQHPQQGLVPPNEFIPLAEEMGLIIPIGQWVLDAACAQLKSWEKGVNTRLLKLAVNISAVQFHQPDFAQIVQQTVQRYKIDPDKLELELTESIVLDDIDDALVKMSALRKVGVRFSLDDFGTGYSSLSYLSELPFDQLKIDQSFVKNIGVKQSDVIVQTIIGMAKNLEMEVIAEGVETEAQRQFLEQEGCPVLQGYLFGKPIPIEQFEKMLTST